MALNRATLSADSEEGDRYLFVRGLPNNIQPGDIATVMIEEDVYTVRVLAEGTLEVLQHHCAEILH